MVTIENSTVINRPPEEVYAFVTDPANEAKWHADVLEAHKTSDGPLGVGSTIQFTFNFMGKKDIDLVVREFDPPRREVVEATSKGPMAPTFTFTFEPGDGGTRFTRKGNIRVSGWMRLMEPMMKGMASKRADGFLAKLKLLLES
jgi:uncharacterized protein YndB with AHSA1/START domain